MFLNPVLETTRFLTENPGYVFIRDEKLADYARDFASHGLPRPSWDMPIFPDKDDPRVLDFFMVMSSVNFHYPPDPETGEKFTVIYRGVPWSGAFGMEASFKRALDEGMPVLDSDYLESMEIADAEHIFRGNMRMPMLEERVGILNDVGGVLNDLYEGRFGNLFRECGYRLFLDDGDGVVPRLSGEFSGFYDSCEYGGREVVFNKKAQMAPALLYGKMEGNIPIPHDDIAKLTVYPDYQLPKVLRDMGILEYESSLAEKIDRQQEILHGSQEEMEIRASTVHASDRLIRAVNEINPAANADVISMDYKLWGMRNLPGGKPHHITRTTAY